MSRSVVHAIPALLAAVARAKDGNEQQLQQADLFFSLFRALTDGSNRLPSAACAERSQPSCHQLPGRLSALFRETA